jgi:hypothetical protein
MVHERLLFRKMYARIFTDVENDGQGRPRPEERVAYETSPGSSLIHVRYVLSNEK